MNNDWVKLFRKFREWEWYSDTNTKCVFLELILTANYTDKHWQGIVIKRGQTVVGRKELAKTLRLSEQSVRTALDHLKSTSEVTSKTYNHFTVITINNFDKYQESTSTSTSNQPAGNQQVTTPKEYKEIKKERSRTVEVSPGRLYGGKWTLNQIGELVVKAFNHHLGSSFKPSSDILPNLAYWLTTYTPQDIEKAIKNIKLDKFWVGKMTPTILFRRKNPQGEPVDYIGLLINLKEEHGKPKYE